jgi:hypothetical protein
MRGSKVDRMNKRPSIVRKVKASSLIEVIVALIIITLIFSFAMTIYLNVQRANFNSLKLTCQMRMSEVFSVSVKTNSYQNREVSYDELVVHQEVRPHSQSANLLIVTLEGRDPNGKIIAEQKHLVYAPVKP